MAFKATQLNTSQAFDSLKRQAAASKVYLQGQRAKMVVNNCDAVVPLQTIQHFGQVNALMSVWAGTPGLAEYARSQYDDPAYDVVAEFQSMKNAIENARSTLTAMFPKDANGWLLYQAIQPDGSILNRTFTAAQLANAVTVIDAVLATID